MLAMMRAAVAAFFVLGIGSTWADSQPNLTSVNRGTTVVTGGTAVSIAANPYRRGGWVRNPCDATESLFVAFGGTATTTTGSPNHADLSACASVPLGGAEGAYRGAVSINAATNGHKFEAVELQ